ncbi:MAG: hypothetical protein QXH12_08865, partial [Candidatus Caldarchaeum sp.]
MFRERETFHATRRFLLSEKAASVKLMDVQEFIERFRAAFESKPVKAETMPQPVNLPAPSEQETPRPSIPQAVAMEAANTALVQVRKPDVQLTVRKPVLHASDQDVLGRLLYAVKKGYFDQRQTVPKAVNILSQFGWLHTRQEVEDALVRLCDMKFMRRKKSTGNMYWYSLEPDARERIIVSEENSF